MTEARRLHSQNRTDWFHDVNERSARLVTALVRPLAIASRSSHDGVTNVTKSTLLQPFCNAQQSATQRRGVLRQRRPRSVRLINTGEHVRHVSPT